MVKGIGGHCQFRSPTPWTGGQGRLQIQLRSTTRSRKIRASFSLAAHQVHTCPSGRLQIVRVNGQNHLIVDRHSQNDFHRMAVCACRVATSIPPGCGVLLFTCLRQKRGRVMDRRRILNNAIVGSILCILQQRAVSIRPNGGTARDP